MLKHPSWSRRFRFAVVLCAALTTPGFDPLAQAVETVFTDNVRIKAGFPALFFEDNFGTPYQWQIIADNLSFDISDVAAGSTSPFRIFPGTPNSTLHLKPDTDGRGNVGINGVPDDGVHLHVKAPNTPVFRMSQSAGPLHIWDILADDVDWSVRENGFPGNTPLTIAAGAPTDSLFVAATGRVGLGTAIPSERLSVAGNMEIGVGATLSVLKLRSTAGNNRIGNDATGLFVASDVSGKRMRFFTNPGAGIQERLTILANGNVGIQQISPTAKLQVGNAKCDGNTWIDVSSRDLKENIRPLSTEEATAALRNLQAVKFAYKSNREEECVGFIAEDVPDLVARNDRRTLHSMDLVGVLAKVVQDQDQQLQNQDRQLDEQRVINKALMERLAKLEQKLAE